MSMRGTKAAAAAAEDSYGSTTVTLSVFFVSYDCLNGFLLDISDEVLVITIALIGSFLL